MWKMSALVSAGLAMSAATLPTVVFTPGAWHGPQSFDLVRDGLTAKGYESQAIKLPSVGADPATVGVAEDAAVLRSTIETLADEGKEVVLVVHSYGGMVGGNAVEGLGYQQRAAENKAGGVIMMVYLSAFAAPKGVSLLDMLSGKYLPWMRAEGDKVFADHPETIFYADVDPVLRAKAISELTWQSARVFSDPSTYEPWNNGIEVMYFHCTEDQAIPLATQNAIAAQFPAGYTTFSANSSHSPFLSHPDLVVEGVELAAKVGKEKITA
ncbi:alpha/beta-hydrolase [Colletotrichum eremochloae]|nr:alpha/beta-hydrolase [Colletotrichum eremochloae]